MKRDMEAFRALAPEAKLNAVRGEKAERTFTFERDGIDKEARTVWLSIASDEPYARWWGVEVLDMKKKSIRQDRLKNGIAILVDHDTTDLVGRAESYEISPDGKLRLLARFGKSARAEEIWQDVLDGIRVNTSVGYQIHDLVLEKQEGDINTYRVTDWEPLEGSLVSVPADPTVGVGRSFDPPANPERKPTMEENKPVVADAAATEKAVKDAVVREQSRVSAILAAGAEFKAEGGEVIASELIKDPNATVDTFRAKQLEAMRGKQKVTATAQAAEFGHGARQIIRHGVLRAFTKPVHYTDGSKMDPIESAFRSGQWLLATVGQSEKAKRWCRDHGLGGHLEHRVMTTDVASAGGYIVPDEMEQSIIDLRTAVGVARRLCRRRPMGTDTLSVPKRTGGVTAYFMNEDNSGVTASDKSWGNVNFVAKTLAALTLISKNLEEDAIIDVVDDLARELAYAFATKEDQCWLIGDGTSTYGGMTGITTLFNGATYASGFTAASGHDTFAEYDNADLSGTMAAVADFPGLNPSWLCSKTFAENVFGRLKRTAGGNNGGDLDRRYAYGYGGHPADTSDIMPKVGTSDSTSVEALFGDFSMSSSFGDRRGVMIEVLRERYAEKLQVGILGHERFHIVNHDLGDANNKGPVAALKGQ